MSDLTQKEVKDLFEYRDGNLYWKKSAGRVKDGDKAGCLDKSNGYIRVRISGKNYRLHRIVFLFHHGYMPEYVDHINVVKQDNRIENLREATSTENNSNTKLNITNTSGVKNIYWNKRLNKWHAQITHKKLRHHMGFFDNKEHAAEFIALAREMLHGEFANDGI